MELDAGETLALGAGNIYRQAAASADRHTHVIYADDDLGAKEKPHFKSDWNAELFEHHDYITGAAIVRCCTSKPAEQLSSKQSASLVAKALARTTNEGGTVTHLPHVLHHRRIRSAPRRPQPQPIPAAIEATLPSISVIVPTRNRHDLLATCLSGLARTNYPRGIEILIIDNGSDDPETQAYLASLDPHFAKVMRDDGPFNFSALNNRAVGCISGKLLCFLNNDIEILEPGWLKTMALQAIREDVGAVGAQLLYPDGRIQHAGVVLGIGGGAAHAHRLVQPEEEGYFHRHALPQFVSAVTAACLVVRRDKFLEIGGFDAKNFAVSFNDVDLCLRLTERGWWSVYEPRATLVHHESVSRGLDRDREGASRLASELAALQDRWGITPAAQPIFGNPRVTDPFHHPALSAFSEHFVLHV
ncbi:MAG: glycosyltransferase family 2 protein [Qipengyuania pacifica]